MIIVDDSNWVKDQLEEKGFSILDFFENHQVLTPEGFTDLPLQRRAEILLVNTKALLAKPALQGKFEAVMNTFLGVVFFHEQKDQKAQDWVQNQAAFMTKIVGEYALPMPQLQWTMLSNQLQFFWNILQEQKLLQKHMAKFSIELDQVMRTAEAEMARAQKIHEVLVPKRNDEIKGVHFQHRYAAGDGGGGEFYDLHQTPQKVYQILVSSQSYLISSALLGLLNQSKQKDFNPTKFLQDAAAEIQTINGSKKKQSEVSLNLFEIDLSQLVISPLAQQGVEFYSSISGQVKIEAPYKLSKNERLFLFSPGFTANWNELRPKETVHSFLKNDRRTGHDVLSELFFQLKMDQDSDFLKKDATAVMMEVNRHGIHQV